MKNPLNRKKKAGTSPVTLPGKIIVYESELDYLSRCILDYPDIETGGNIFGMYSPFGIPIIYYVVGPGPEAVHNITHFRQDFRFLDQNADRLVEGHALHHIGSWHSHHSLGLTRPSEGDSVSTLEGMRECGLEKFLLLIGNCRSGVSSVRPYMYSSHGQYSMLKWVVLPGESPIRSVYDRSNPELVYRPRMAAGSMGELETAPLTGAAAPAPAKVTYPEGYWLGEKKGRDELGEILKFLKSRFDSVRIYQREDLTIEIQVVSGINVVKIHFDENFPAAPPRLYAHKGSNLRAQGVAESWHYEDNVFESFVKYIETIDL